MITLHTETLVVRKRLYVIEVGRYWVIPRERVEAKGWDYDELCWAAYLQDEHGIRRKLNDKVPNAVAKYAHDLTKRMERQIKSKPEPVRPLQMRLGLDGVPA